MGRRLRAVVAAAFCAVIACAFLDAQSTRDRSTGGEGAAAPAEAPTFRTEARLVVLHATVKNNRGQLVTDLTRDAFTVTEDGKRQPIALFRNDDVPVSIGLLIDNSGSMRAKRAKVEAAALTFVRASNPLDEVFVMNFADKVRVDVPMTNDIRTLEAGISRVDSIGGTAMRDAIDAGERYLTDHATRDRRVLLVVTDGNDNASDRPGSQIQRLAEERGVSIYAVGLLNDEDPSKAREARHELNQLAGTTGGAVYYPAGVDEIDGVALDLARQIRTQYTIAFAPAHQARDGSYHRIKLSASGQGPLTVQTRTGYRAVAGDDTSLAAQAGAASAYRVTHTYTLGGEGSWDYIVPDPATHRLFIGRQNRVMVVDQNDGKLLGEVTGIQGAHGTAIASATGHGFATSGNDRTVVMFDLQTFKTLGRIPAAEDTDAIIFDPASNRVFTFNGDAHSSTVIDPGQGALITNIPLGGKPEYGASAGDGKVYANLTDTSEVVEIDAKSATVSRRWPTAPCRQPVAMAIDPAHHRLFSGCRSGLLAVSDYQTGRVVATVPIGQGVDGTGYDPAAGDVFASNADGTLTVIHQDAPDRYRVVQTVPTPQFARNMGLDPTNHRIFIVSAKFGAAPAGGRGRGPLLPDTFALMVIERDPPVR